MSKKEEKNSEEQSVQELETPKEEPSKEIIAEENEEKEEKKQEEKQDGKVGIAYIFSSQNNTIIHITDLAGNTLSRVSGGMITKQSRLKADPTVAMFAAKRAAETAKDLGITSLYVRVRAKTGSMGLGPGAHSAVKSLDKSGLKILNVLDTTRYPRGGPKKKGGKRGRRV